MSFNPPPFTDILGQSYASLPQESQLLLATSILGISPTWLSQSFLLDAQKPNRLLANSLDNIDTNLSSSPQKTSASPVVLVSFMNDFEYYRALARRMGIDLPTLTHRKQFAFVDCLSNLFSTTSSIQSAPNLDQSTPAISNNTQLSNIQKAIEAAIHTVSSSPSTTSSTTTISPAPSRTPQTAHARSSSSGGGNKTGIKPKLIIEYPDILCSAGCIPAQEVMDMLLDVRELCAVTLVVVSADDPFVIPILSESSGEKRGGGERTELEVNTAALVGMLGHAADAVVGLRWLDTGVAEDVTGVIRVTRGGGGVGGGGNGGGIEEKEVLYYVGDRDVKMFGRGENV